MIDSGFRPYPGDEIGKKWVDMGGTWMVTVQNGRYPTFTTVPEYWGKGFLYRPIHPSHGWNHYPWMWAELTGEDMTPKTTGPHWWRRDTSEPWQVLDVFDSGYRHYPGQEPCLRAGYPGWSTCMCAGQWGGPVEGMPGEVGR